MPQDTANLRKSFSPTPPEAPHAHCKCVELLTDDNRHLKQELAKRVVPSNTAVEDDWDVFERLLHRYAVSERERVRACLQQHVAPHTQPTAPTTYPMQTVYDRQAITKEYSARRPR